MLIRGILFGVVSASLVASVYAGPKAAVELDEEVSKATEFKYKGQKQLTKEESELLLADTEHKKKQAQDTKDCPPDGVKVADAPKKDEKVDPKKDDWKVVFLMRLSVKSDDSTKSTTISKIDRKSEGQGLSG